MSELKDTCIDLGSISSFDMLPFRTSNFGRIYDKLEPDKIIYTSPIGSDKATLIIDEKNLGLDRVSYESLVGSWEIQKDAWIESCRRLGITIDPFQVYKYHLIQEKALSILGKPNSETMKERDRMYLKSDGPIKLSQLKGAAMCAEFAVLCGYMAQKVGDSVHLINGSIAVNEGDPNLPWREGHAYLWIDGINAIYDGSLVKSENEFPLLLVPQNSASLETLENGFDVAATRIGTKSYWVYGLEAGGYGVDLGK